MSKIRILFLAANPIDTDRLRLDEEVRTIDQRLRMATYRDRFELIQHWAVRRSDLTEYLLRHTPHIVHFSGHGSAQAEIILEANTGEAKAVSAEALCRLFRTLKDNIRCVVLNACYSATQAEAIAKEIDCVVGMSSTISDGAALHFASGFYRGLGFGRDVHTAFEIGVTEIDIDDFSEETTPKFLVRSGVDAGSITFGVSSKSRGNRSSQGSTTTISATTDVSIVSTAPTGSDISFETCKPLHARSRVHTRISVTASELDDAITRYGVRVLVPSLKHGRPRLIRSNTHAGQVKTQLTYSGAFTRVYCWTNDKGQSRAVRLYYDSPSQEHLQHLRRVGEYLTHNLPNNTVRFEIYEKGLIIQPTSHLVMPLIDMEWVEGGSLLRYVDQSVLDGDTVRLRRLSEQWSELMRRIRKLGMAHGKLCGENVIIRDSDKSPVLISYDNVFVPGLLHAPYGSGHPAYEHPNFQERSYGPGMDNFSSLLIYIALLSLVEKPSLWEKYSHWHYSGELVSTTLLFRPEDLSKPDSSKLFQELSQLSVRPFVSMLRNACYSPVNEVPNFF
jgi:hypothetical protein